MRYFVSIVALSILSIAGCSSVENLANQQRVIGLGDVSITIPHTLTVTRIDGESINAPSLSDGDYTLKLNEGVHHISLKYYENWDTSEESGNIFSSAPLSLKADFRSSGIYSFHHPLVDSADAAEKFVNTPEIWLLDNNNRIDAVAIKEKQTIIEALGIESLAKGLERIVEEPVKVDGKTDRLLILKEAWLNASEEERNAFWLWIRRESH